MLRNGYENFKKYLYEHQAVFKNFVVPNIPLPSIYNPIFVLVKNANLPTGRQANSKNTEKLTRDN